MAINVDDLLIGRSDDRNVSGLHTRIVSQHEATRAASGGTTSRSQHLVTQAVVASQHVLTKTAVSADMATAASERAANKTTLSNKVESQHGVTRTSIGNLQSATETVVRSQHGVSNTVLSQAIADQNNFMLQNIGSNVGPMIAFVDNIDLPNTGSKDVKVIVRNYDMASFNMDADSLPTLSVLDFSGNASFSVPLNTAMTHTDTGGYEYNFTIDASDLAGEYRIVVDVINNAKEIKLVDTFVLMDYDNTPIMDRVTNEHITTRADVYGYVNSAHNGVKARVDVQDTLIVSQHALVSNKVESQHVLTKTHVSSQNETMKLVIDQYAKQLPRVARMDYNPVYSDKPTLDDVSAVDDNWVDASPVTGDGTSGLSSNGTAEARWAPMYGLVIEHPYWDEAYNSGKIQTVGGIKLSLKWKTIVDQASGGNTFWAVKSGGDNSAAEFYSIIANAEAADNEHRLTPNYEAKNVSTVHTINTVLRTAQMEEIPFSIWLAGQVNVSGAILSADLSSRINVDFAYTSEI